MAFLHRFYCINNSIFGAYRICENDSFKRQMLRYPAGLEVYRGVDCDLSLEHEHTYIVHASSGGSGDSTHTFIFADNVERYFLCY